MKRETAVALIARIQSLETEVDTLQSIVASEDLVPSKRQYLARCFDLLQMELAAVRNFIAAFE